MITKILLFIKHKIPFIWSCIELVNAFLFKILYFKRINKISENVLQEFYLKPYNYKKLEHKDIKKLEHFISNQEEKRLKFFKPHKFDYKSLVNVLNNPSFLMMGVFENEDLVGYYFLRFFWNKKCFVGRLIDEKYEGKGIGRVMNEIMYNIAWSAGFKCLSTISKNNNMVMRSHSNNKTMIILKELPNDYLFVEFIRPQNP